MVGFKSGLFWGAFFGGLAGLMNAPKSGKETREDLKHFIDTTTDDVNDVRYKVDNLRMSVQKLTQEGMDSVKTATDGIQTSLQHFEEETTPRINRIQRHIEDLNEDIEEQVEEINLNN
ncbi:MAG: YtxH domain-containing protein [Ruoffia tabacinasalis]|uniref:YtxH domain-containing protein n=1 Tax=Ruoffia tabacinasalis TaxID=87458 RepID=A0A5R9DVR8_9LACT|nr:YtxH domain-containing protein [Ruoffia tabacinasalis]TLQ40185.1 YtxH domain-containing protein [Ruoffia tabacinasalis]HBY90564.1 hypothetical protein [Aerococcaceae bacterium]